MRILGPLFSFVSEYRLFSLVAVAVIVVLFSPELKHFYRRLRGSKPCPACGARMRIVERSGKRHWSCTECSAKQEINW